MEMARSGALFFFCESGFNGRHRLGGTFLQLHVPDSTAMADLLHSLCGESVMQ